VYDNGYYNNFLYDNAYYKNLICECYIIYERFFRRFKSILRVIFGTHLDSLLNENKKTF